MTGLGESPRLDEGNARFQGPGSGKPQGGGRGTDETESQIVSPARRLGDYERAPDSRQLEIAEFPIRTALNDAELDIAGKARKEDKAAMAAGVPTTDR